MRRAVLSVECGWQSVMAVCSSSWRSFLFIVFPLACLRNNHALVNGHAVTVVYPVLTAVFHNDVADDASADDDQVELHGRYFASGMQIKLTGNETQCDGNKSGYELREMWILSATVARLTVVPATDSVVNTYFCLRPNSSPTGGIPEWRHAGKNVFIKFSPRTPQHDAENSRIPALSLQSFKNRRDVDDPNVPPLRITGVRIEHSDKEPLLSETGDGVPLLLAEAEAVVRLFGDGITADTWITFTQHQAHYGGACQLTAGGEHRVEQTKEDLRTGTGRIHISLPLSTDGGPFYVCAKQQHVRAANITATEAVPYVHQGSEPWLQIRTYKKLLPLAVSIVIIIVCLSFSALFSGLNLGLMSLDRTELKILCNTGNESEQKYARIIQPVRDHGNYLLCSILLGNVLVNSTFTILLDDLTSGLIAIVCSTLAIVMFGEISPQALCSRHGLAVGAKTIYITKAVMILTFPLSYPISRVLDVILGEEIGNVYNRERLKELVKVTTDINDLDRDEVNIISGALELRKKTVAAVMTRIEDVFMLENEAVLDFETVSEIMKSGFSRIPVYEGNRNNIVTLLYIKDLAFVDPDDNTPLKTLCQFYQNPCNFVFEDETLDVMFRQFKEGNKGHMAFVTRVNNEGECDPFYETIGLVTLEDVIEELIQAEIMDETDVFTDNRSKRRRLDKTKRQDFSMFAGRRENQRIQVSPQLALATYQYLSTSVDLFKKDALSETTLRRLLKQDVFRHIKKNKKHEKDDMSIYIYQQGKPVDYFALILEGRVEVTVGKENLIFEAGPFTYFGLQALTQGNSVAESPVVASQMGSLQSLNLDAKPRVPFLPDYSVRAVAEVLYMIVRRNLYLAAKRATLMERSTTDHLDDDDDKFLYSLDGDEESSMGRTSPRQMDTAAQPPPPSSNNHQTSATSPRLQSPAVDTTEFNMSGILSPLDPNGVATFPQDEQQHEEELTSLLLKRPTPTTPTRIQRPVVENP